MRGKGEPMNWRDYSFDDGSPMSISAAELRHLRAGCDALSELMTAIDDKPLVAALLDGTNAMKQAAEWTDEEAKREEVLAS
jgi:hypothetical protein